MMRLNFPRRLAWLLGAACAFSLLALLPMRLALDRLGLERSGFTAREAAGSVWSGVIADARIGPLAIGTVQAGLEPLPLLLGRARLELRSGGGEGFSGTLIGGGASFGIDGASGRLRLDAAAAPLPLSSLEFSDATAIFQSGACRTASGRVRAEVVGSFGAVALGEGLAGTLRCDGAALLLPLASRSGMESLRLRILPDGRYTAEFLIRSNDPSIAAAMASLGFAAVPDGYAMRVEGSLGSRRDPRMDRD